MSRSWRPIRKFQPSCRASASPRSAPPPRSSIAITAANSTAGQRCSRTAALRSSEPGGQKSAKLRIERLLRRSDVRVARIFAWVMCVLCATIGFAGHAAAQGDAKSYPNQPIHIVVPFAAGGATDVTVRLIAQKLTEEWGATVIIENKPGATGAIAAEYVAKAKPDGYTLLMGTGSVNSVFPAVKKNLPFDTMRDFAAISNFFVTPNILVVHPSVPAQNVAEFIALLKANPRQYNFASSGAGSSIHLSGELFKQMAGVDMVHVPYKGSAPAVADLVAGHVKVMFDNLASS